jgi:hypothetical protein
MAHTKSAGPIQTESLEIFNCIAGTDPVAIDATPGEEKAYQSVEAYAGSREIKHPIIALRIVFKPAACLIPV